MTGPVRYLPLLEQFDRWQADTRARHPGVMPCRAGCTACCDGPFDISIADVELVRDAVAALPEPVRTATRERARAQVAQMTALEPGWTAPWDIRTIGDARFDRISDALADLPCPALDDTGACLIYHARPMICRLMGLGLVTESGDVIENGCPIQDRFPAYLDLPAEPFPLEAWEAQEEIAKREAAARLGSDDLVEFETTIAAAIAAGSTP